MRFERNNKKQLLRKVLKMLVVKRYKHLQTKNFQDILKCGNNYSEFLEITSQIFSVTRSEDGYFEEIFKIETQLGNSITNFEERFGNKEVFLSELDTVVDSEKVYNRLNMRKKSLPSYQKVKGMHDEMQKVTKRLFKVLYRNKTKQHIKSLFDRFLITLQSYFESCAVKYRFDNFDNQTPNDTIKNRTPFKTLQEDVERLEK